MTEPPEVRRVRLDPTRVPASVRDDPEKWRVWRRLWQRVMLRWTLLALAFAVPFAVLVPLTFRLRVVPEPITVTVLCILLGVEIVLMFPMRRWAQRQTEEFARRELPEREWS